MDYRNTQPNMEQLNFIDLSPLCAQKSKRARRACFLKNMDPHFQGISLTVSKKHYQVFGMLLEALTVSLTQHVVLKSAISRLYRVDGQLIKSLKDIYEGDIIVCCCKNEVYMDVGYSIKRSHVKYLGSIMSKKDNLPNKDDDDFLLKLTPNKLPKCITLYFDVSEVLSQKKNTAIFKSCGRFNNKQNYIIKIVDKEHMRLRSQNNYIEIEALRQLQSHENIIDLIITVEHEKYVYIILERLDCDLLNLKSMFDGPFEESLVQRLMIDVAKGLEFMHSCQIIHRDIKLENLLVQLRPGTDMKSMDIVVVKIADFGLSALYMGQDLDHWCGTPIYMAPELINYAGYDFSVDCWSFGVTLFYLLCNQYPFGKDYSEVNDIINCILNDMLAIPVEYAMRLSLEAVHLIKSLLEKSRQCRISATEICKHPFLQIKH